MTKVCTHGRDKALAMKMLEESLHRLQTDHLDLWQIHGVVFENDPELFIRPNGAAEALAQGQRSRARSDSSVSPATKIPTIHLKMLQTGFPFDCGANAAESVRREFRISFEKQVLPELNRRGIAALGMKPICGTAIR